MESCLRRPSHWVSVFIACLALGADPSLGKQAGEGQRLGGYPMERPVASAAGRYFVAFYNPPGPSERAMVTGHGAQILHAYSLVPAYAIQAGSDAIVEAIRQDDRVHYVEPDNVMLAQGNESDPEIDESASAGDQSPPGNATQDILAAWLSQPDTEHLLFSIRVQSLAGANPQTGDGFPINGIWKLVFSLQKPGSTAADEYYVEMRKPETGPPTFGYGFIDGNFATDVGPADAGTIHVESGIIEILMTNTNFAGAPNGNAAPGAGDVLGSPYVECQQLVGATGVGGVLVNIDRAPNSGGGRSFPLQSVTAEFSVQPGSLDFGSLEAGASGTITATVTNSSSTRSLTVSNVTSNNTAFTVTPSGAVLAPGTSQGFEVSFRPPASGPYAGSLVFQHDAEGSPTSVPMQGSAFSTADGEDVPWGITTVGAPAVWERTTGRTIKVAVLDTGIDALHFDLDDRFRGGYNFVTDTPVPADGHGHGTHCAGTIAGERNGVGVVGVAPEVELYALKVLSDAGSGFESDILAAIDWCVQNDIRVASMSLGGRVPSTTGLSAYGAAFAAGLLVVAAAGNGVEGVGTPVLNFPAGYPDVLAVGAVDRTLARAQFSDFGPGLEVVAPGVDVRSTFPRGTGSEARVDHAGARLDANPLEFAATTPGITALAVDAGLGLLPSDYPPESAGNIVLVQRGGTSFADKVRAAQDAGAIGVILYNNAAGNFNGTLGTARDDTRGRDWVPAVSMSQEDGAALAALPDHPTVTIFNGRSDFTKLSGTSMACPHVSGVAALVFGSDPLLSNEQVRAIIDETATDLGAPGWDPLHGFGLVNAAAAVGRVATPPVITHLDCDDPSVSRSGGWHRVEDSRASDGHYCRNVGAGGGEAFLEFAWSGSKVEMRIARGPRGGNAEVFIDATSQGLVDFHRDPADPDKPDHSGKKDLSFGEVAAFETADGDHVFRLVVRNDSPEPQRDMIYVDEFVIHDGASSGTGNPTETSVSAAGTVAGLTDLLTGAPHLVATNSSTLLITAVLEVPDGNDLSLYLLDPLGRLMAQSATHGATEVVRWIPAGGPYTFVVANSQSQPSPYHLYTISTTQMTTSDQPEIATTPPAYRLDPNVPNPFNPRTRIPFALPQGGRVRLAVYDVAGRLVQVLLNEERPAGEHLVWWDGRSKAGLDMPSGVYFYELAGGGTLATRKMTLLR